MAGLMPKNQGTSEKFFDRPIDILGFVTIECGQSRSTVAHLHEIFRAGSPAHPQNFQEKLLYKLDARQLMAQVRWKSKQGRSNN
ncbi:hypothetical protein C7B69_26095 [filamentous cyanobacterium Phorm 46]|nr:hypothetical protein C7B69_26095 [filamentous cyanobacterium Phorm 46]